MNDAAQNSIQWDLVTGIEQMISAGRKFTPVTGEGLLRPENALANFGIAVGKAPAGSTKSDVSIWTEGMADAQFRIQIRWGNRQPQRQICAEKVGLVSVIISIAGLGRVALHRDVKSHLDQIAPDWIDLRKGGKRAADARHDQ